MRAVLFTYYLNSEKNIKALYPVKIQGLAFAYSYKIDIGDNTVVDIDIV